MNRRSLTALVVINAVLLAALLVAVLSPQPARAQFGGGASYIMIAGEVSGRKSQAGVFIVNLSTGQVLPLMFTTANNALETFRVRNVGDDATRALRSR